MKLFQIAIAIIIYFILNNQLIYAERKYHRVRCRDVFCSDASKSDRKEKLKKKSRKSTDKQIEAHMKAELSFYKIPRQSKNYKKNLINNSFMLTKSELDDYFRKFVTSEYDISNAKINPKYVKTQNDADIYGDNTKLKEQAIKLIKEN